MWHSSNCILHYFFCFCFSCFLDCEDCDIFVSISFLLLTWLWGLWYLCFNFLVAYLTVRTVAITTMGSRRMEMRMGRRTTEGDAEDILFSDQKWKKVEPFHLWQSRWFWVLERLLGRPWHSEFRARLWWQLEGLSRLGHWRVSEICTRIFMTCDFHNWPPPQRAIKRFLVFDNLQSKSHLTVNQISIKRGNIFKFQH